MDRYVVGAKARDIVASIFHLLSEAKLSIAIRTPREDLSELGGGFLALAALLRPDLLES